MQKKLIVLAVASMAALPALAQSNVTIYGVADVYFKSTWGDGKRVTGVDAGGENGSRLGFKGTEDLGNGLKAIFDFQFGSLNLDQAQGINSTRYSFVGLQGGFGTVVAGRLQTPGYYSSYYFDPAAAHFFSGYQRLSKGIAANGVGGSINTGWSAPSRQNNSVAYMLPEFGGVKTTVFYGFGEQEQGDRQGFGALGFDYANGPVRASYTYHRIDNVGGTSTDQQEHFVGASYDFGIVKVLGSWQNARVKRTGFATETDKVWNVGATVKVGPAGMLMVGYAKADVDRVASDGKGYTLGYMHSLSKRTHLYGGYGRVTNEAATTRFNWREDFAIADGKAVNTVGFGVSHLF